MKLRLRGESLRIRLTKMEVVALRDQGWSQEASTLGPDSAQRLVYRVEAADVGKPEMRYTGGMETVVAVVLPVAEVLPWPESTKIGHYFETDWGMKVAVEKDFQCLDPRRDEDESDNYANPLAGSSQHTECCAG